jgi:TonB family protein
MRQELEVMDMVERYLDGAITTEERAAIERRITGDATLRELVEDQRALRAGMERIATRGMAIKAYRSYRFWKLAPWFAAGLIVLSVVTAILLWPTEAHETHSEHNDKQPAPSVAIEAPISEEPEAEFLHATELSEAATWGETTDSALVISEATSISDSIVETRRTVVEQRKVPMETHSAAPMLEAKETRGGEDVHLNTAHLDPSPTFPGGDPALGNYLMRNLRYPTEAERTGVQGRIMISYIVMKDGTIQGARVEQGIDRECDEEALRVVRNMPDWIPGQANGELVNVRMVMPIVFTLRMERAE